MREREQKTAAIILSNIDVFEADRLYLLFTRELGKLRARAKGVRRPTSRLTGHLLQFLPTDLVLVHQGEFFLIIQAHMQEQQAYPADSLTFLKYAEQVGEAVDKLVIDLEAHPELYDGLAYTLERLRQTQAPALVTAEFLFKAVIILGYKPELQTSVLGGELNPERLAWNSELGGVLTPPPAGLTPGSLRIESAKTVVALRQLAKPEFVAERLGMSEEVLQETIEIIYHYVQTIIGKPLKSV